jgi:hypothetical protein
VFTSQQRKLASCDRTTASCASSRACQSRSPISAAVDHDSIEHQGLPYDASRRALFGVPIVTTNAQAAGVGHVLAADAVALDTDTHGVDVTWSKNATATTFGSNQIVAGCESRYNTSAFSPLGCASLDLTP